MQQTSFVWPSVPTFQDILVSFFTSPTLDPLVLVLFYVEMGARWQVGILCQCSGCREAPSTSCTLATLLALTISTFHHQLAICIPLQNHHILSDGIKTGVQNETCFKKRKLCLFGSHCWNDDLISLRLRLLLLEVHLLLQSSVLSAPLLCLTLL